MKIQNVKTKMSEAAIKKLVADENVSKSQKMKQLFEAGLEIKEISNLLNVRYNFVYNVISNYVRMNEVTVEKTEKQGKKEQIIELFKQGKNNTEISTLLKTNYQYVYKIVKEYKELIGANEKEAAAE